MTEHGYAVQPRSTEAIARAAENFLKRHAPDHLSSGQALDLAHLVDYGLQKDRIFAYPVSPDDLPDAEAEARAGQGEWLEIWIREEFFGALFDVNSNTNRARSTLGHEIGHAVLHKSEIRTGRRRPHVLALRRALRTQLQAFRDSEWQAHTFAGALLIPRPALRRIQSTNPQTLAAQFQVSEAFVRSHFKRIRRVL